MFAVRVGLDYNQNCRRQLQFIMIKANKHFKREKLIEFLSEIMGYQKNSLKGWSRGELLHEIRGWGREYLIYWKNKGEKPYDNSY